MQRLDSGINAIVSKVADFRALFKHKVDGRVVKLECVDHAALADLLAAVQKNIEKEADFSNPSYFAACEDSGITEADLKIIPDQTPEQLANEANVQSGDLCELIACFAIAAFGSFNATRLFPKNVLKINRRYSERGLDVIAVSLADDESAEPLHADDRLFILEAKSSISDGTHALHTDAVENYDSAGIMKMREELRKLASDYGLREGITARLERIKFFLFKHKQNHTALTYGAMLSSSKSHTLSSAVAASGPFQEVYTLVIDIAVVCAIVYKHRK